MTATSKEKCRKTAIKGQNLPSPSSGIQPTPSAPLQCKLTYLVGGLRTTGCCRFPESRSEINQAQKDKRFGIDRAIHHHITITAFFPLVFLLDLSLCPGLRPSLSAICFRIPVLLWCARGVVSVLGSHAYATQGRSVDVSLVHCACVGDTRVIVVVDVAYVYSFIHFRNTSSGLRM